MILILGILILASLLVFKSRNNRLRREREAAEAEQAYRDRRFRRFEHGIRESVRHKRKRDDHETRAASEPSDLLPINYR